MNKIIQKQGATQHTTTNTWCSYYEVDGQLICLMEKFLKSGSGCCLIVSLYGCKGMNDCNRDYPLLIIPITNNLDVILLKHVQFKLYSHYEEYCQQRTGNMVNRKRYHALQNNTGADLADWLKVITNFSSRHSNREPEENAMENEKTFLQPLPSLDISRSDLDRLAQLVAAVELSHGKGQNSIATLEGFIKEQLRDFLNVPFGNSYAFVVNSSRGSPGYFFVV